MAAPAPMWTKRVPGSALLFFFVSLIVFSYLAVHFWNDYEMELTGLFTALASAAPLVIVYVFYVMRPIWAVQAPVDEPAVERAIRAAVAERRVRQRNDRRGVFRVCSSVLEVSEPHCTVGWFGSPSGPAAPPIAGRSTVLLIPRSWDRKALAAFRGLISGALLRAQASVYADT